MRLSALFLLRRGNCYKAKEPSALPFTGAVILISIIQPAAMAESSTDAQSFDDVDELIPDGQTREAVAEHVRCGNTAFRKGSFEQAINEYSRAYKLQPAGAVVTLSNRSAAFSKLSKHLRNIPAAVSERRALLALDPTYYAELALKDAEKVVNMQDTWIKGYYRKGTALILLERYDEAQDAFLAGLQIDPSSSPLQSMLQQLISDIKEGDPGSVGKSGKRAKLQRLDDFDCVLCLKLFYKPVTTPCGHTFCRACLLQAMDHGNKCPICRVVLLLNPKTYPISVTLNNIIEKNFPEEYAARKEEADTLALASGREILPLFVMDVVIPCEKMSLHIFEPRYRLMVRRVMEGNRRMGMVGIDPETGIIADAACEVEITECDPLPDGRFYLEVEGKRRCNISKTWEQDGYRIGQVTWLQDVGVEDESSLKELQDVTKSTAELFKTWIKDRLNGAASVLSQVEGMPDTSNPEHFSFWVAALLRLRSSDKLRLLRLTDTRERLVQVLIFLGAGTSRGCRLQ